MGPGGEVLDRGRWRFGAWVHRTKPLGSMAKNPKPGDEYVARVVRNNWGASPARSALVEPGLLVYGGPIH